MMHGQKNIKLEELVHIVFLLNILDAPASQYAKRGRVYLSSHLITSDVADG